jgi:hypothetical protein
VGKGAWRKEVTEKNRYEMELAARTGVRGFVVPAPDFCWSQHHRVLNRDPEICPNATSLMTPPKHNPAH